MGEEGVEGEREKEEETGGCYFAAAGSSAWKGTTTTA